MDVKQRNRLFCDKVQTFPDDRLPASVVWCSSSVLVGKYVRQSGDVKVST